MPEDEQKSILQEQQQQALASKKRKADAIQAQKESVVVVGKRAQKPSFALQLSWQNDATIQGFLSEGKNTSKSKKRAKKRTKKNKK